MIKEETITQSKTPVLELLKNRQFLLLWIAQIVSQTAQQMINYTLILQVDEVTGSSTAVAGIIICFTIPAILFAAVAGVFVERNSKKTMLVLTNVARGVMVLAYVLTDTQYVTLPILPVLYAVTLLFSAVSQFFNPAELAMIPLLVKREQLVAANSLFNLSFTACQFAGFIVLGPLLLGTILHKDYAMLYIILFGLYLACAAVTYFLPQDSPGDTALVRRQRGEKVGVPQVAAGATEIARSGIHAAREELAEGWAFIRQDPVIVSAIVYWSIAITVFLMLGTIGPGFLSKVLGLDTSQLVYIMMPGGLGLVVGVIIVGRIATPANRESMINIALFLAGLVLLIFALVEPVTRELFRMAGHEPPASLMLGLLGVMTFLLGLLNSFIGVPAQTALQERSPEEVRARVFGVFFTVSNLILILPVLLAGLLADWLGYPQTVLLTGVVVMLVAGNQLYRRRRQGPQPAPTLPIGRTSDGFNITEEAEAALSAASPGAQPLPTISQRGKTDRET